VTGSGKAGYCDFKSDKISGSCRSRFQYIITNTGSMIGLDLKCMIYEEIPQDIYDDTY